MLLRFVVALPVIVEALRLTPVQHGTQKVDLAYESHIATSALSNALLKLNQGNILLDDAKSLLQDPEIQRLQSVAGRWTAMEERLRGAIASAPSSQVELDYMFTNIFYL
jgi:hypothetical protein